MSRMSSYFSTTSNEIKLEKSDFIASALNAAKHSRKNGWMIKQGQKNKSDFKRRFFILDRNCLFYYASEDCASVIGMIWVEDCKAESLDVDKSTGSYPFKVTTVGDREYYLKCTTSEERNSWIDILRESQFSHVNNNLQMLGDKSSTLAEARDAAQKEVDSLQSQAREESNLRDAAHAELERVRAELRAHADATSSELAELRRHQEIQESLSSMAIAQLEQEKVSMEDALNSAKCECDILRRSKGIRVRKSGGEDDLGGDSTALRMWVGSWNLGASEPFDSNSGSATRLLRDSFIVGDPCDIYFLGLQEGVTEQVFNITESLAGILARCERIPLSDIPSGASSGGGQEDKAASRDKIHGRGDGSLMGTKFTGLALYINKSRCNDLRVIGCVAHPLEKLGSKGGVAVALNISGTTIVLVTCHLEANKRDVRRAQYRELMHQLGEKLGEKDFDLTVQFHHVIWTGDLNYRCVETNGEPMAAERVASMLRSDNNGRLFEDHDQLNQEIRAHEVFSRFREPVPHPEFYPTYKKFEGREMTNYDGDWVAQVYRMRYKEPIYKGGNVKERTPGYCDRVIYHSMEGAWGRLVPERKSIPTDIVRDDGSVSNILVDCDNYSSVNDGAGMSVSDHSPISAVFNMKTTRAVGAKWSQGRARKTLGVQALEQVIRHTSPPLFENPKVTIEVMQFAVKGGRIAPEATRLDVLFPAPGELAEGGLCLSSTQSNQNNGWLEEPTRLKADGRRMRLNDHLFSVNPMPTLRFKWDSSMVSRPSGVGGLHLLLSVRGGTFVSVGHHDSASDDMKDVISAHCAIELSPKGISFTKDDEGKESEAIMSFSGIPLTSEGRPSFYPPGSVDQQLTANVQIRVIRSPS